MEVVRVVHGLLNQYDADTVYTGLVASALITQDPEISPEELQAGVKATTEFIAMYLGTVGETVN